MKKDITEKEWELVESIRNFRKIYPPSIDLEFYILHLLNELMENQ